MGKVANNVTPLDMASMKLCFEDRVRIQALCKVGKSYSFGYTINETLVCWLRFQAFGKVGNNAIPLDMQLTYLCFDESLF